MTQLTPSRGDARGGFVAAYGREPDDVWSAPGRVNLLGEHTDYNDGLCLPMALELRAGCAVGRNGTGRLRITSAQRAGVVDLPIADLAPGVIDGWAAYVAGAVWAHPERFGGLDVLVDSDVPEGAGLSSSAALECATLGALGGLPAAEVARLGQLAENEFVGVPCGRMDQTAATLSQAGTALLFDARDLSTRAVPLSLAGPGLELLVVDTRAPHQLTAGDYAARRGECLRAAAELAVPSLREAVGVSGLGHPERRRARHVITEISRVRAAVELLDAGRVAGLGALMTASHVSLRDDFEVSVPELDLAVGVALASGALGARLTGGGFGGSIVVLTVDGAAVAREVEVAFAAWGWAEPQWFVAEPAGGLCGESQVRAG